jgi:hypothetical protein
MGMTKTCHDLLGKGPWVGERHRRFFPSFVARCRVFNLATACKGRPPTVAGGGEIGIIAPIAAETIEACPGDYFSTPSLRQSLRSGRCGSSFARGSTPRKGSGNAVSVVYQGRVELLHLLAKDRWVAPLIEHECSHENAQRVCK